MGITYVGFLILWVALSAGVAGFAFGRVWELCRH